MVKVIAGTSPILLAATLVMGAGGGQTPSAAAGQAARQQVMVVGCVARNGAVDVNKGTRTLDIGAGALALTGARMIESKQADNVPGTPPQDHDSGTIPQRTIVGGQPGERGTMAFALTGNKTAELDKLVGRRLEVIGRLSDAGAPANTEPRGTTGVQRDTAPVAGTREERSDEQTAHPSAELRQLEVVSFQLVSGGCE